MNLIFNTVLWKAKARQLRHERDLATKTMWQQMCILEEKNATLQAELKYCIEVLTWLKSGSAKSAVEIAELHVRVQSNHNPLVITHDAGDSIADDHIAFEISDPDGGWL